MSSPGFGLDFAIEEQWHIEYPLFRIGHFLTDRVSPDRFKVSNERK